MYAIIDIGKKQYKVSVGDEIIVEKLCYDKGERLDLKVILKADENGIDTKPSQASAEVLGHGRAKKITVFKYKPKKNIRKKQGHRQQFSKIRILSI